MKIATRVLKNTGDLFGPFGLDFEPKRIKFPKCIAYENLAGDDAIAVYEMYIDGEPRLFALAESDIGVPMAETGFEWIKKWARTDEVTLLGEKGTLALFELKLPFGIRFERSNKLPR